MGKSVNRVHLLGNVGREPEIRQTGGGTTVATASLALSERRKVNGEWVDQTEWVNIQAFGKTAEVIRDYVTKGAKLYVEGKLQTQSWQDKQSGEKKYKTVVIIDELVLLSSNQGQRNASPEPIDDPEAPPF